MRHDELQHDLACHLRGATDRMVWENTQLGPVASPRPDVFTINKSYARFAADAYEIKVSVSDLRRDTTSGKWQSYRKFAHRVWFAFERGLVPLDEVPRECGVILHGPGGWRAARKPVAQVLDTLPRDAWLKLLIESSPSEAVGHRNEPRLASRWLVEQKLREKMGKEVADLFTARLLADGSYEDATKRLKESADKIRAEVEERRKNELATIEASERRLSDAMKDLGEALGMSREDLTPGALRGRLVDLRWSLQRGGLLNAISTLQRLSEIISEPEPANV